MSTKTSVDWIAEVRCLRCGKGPMVTDTSSGETFCSKCGYVVREKIEETGPDWRGFSKDGKEDKRHTGTPFSLTMHDMGLSTIIGPADRDASGKGLSPHMKSMVDRLRTWDSRSQLHAPIDRNLKQAFTELDALVDKLGISGHVVEQAAYVYRKAVEKGLVRGRSISAIIAAALYAACRLTETPRTLKDIARVSQIPRKELARSYRLLVKELNIQMPIPDLIRAATRIAVAAKLSERTKRRAIEVLQLAQKAGLSAGKDPMGLAAAALYTACLIEGENKTQKDLAVAAGVTEVTIRNRYKGIRLALKGLGYPQAALLDVVTSQVPSKRTSSDNKKELAFVAAS